MKAQLKRLHSPDVRDLRIFEPQNPTNFQVFVQAMVGPEGDDSYESFDLIVCTPHWLAEKIAREGPVLGLHHIVVAGFDYAELLKFIQGFCSSCEGESWKDVAVKVALLGRWEFEDYRP
jgi:hypothetical protein